MEKAKRCFFTEDYKRQTVDLVARVIARSIRWLAELGLSETVLRKWVNKFDVSRQAAAALRPMTQAALPTADQASEVAKLKREKERLRIF